MLLIFCLFFMGSVFCEGPTITLPDGKIEGLSGTTTQNGMPYYAYLGIPFAAPPVGNFRMKPPQPVKKWNNTFSATSNNRICYQISSKVHFPQSEDCLTINVVTPIKPGVGGNLPVVVSIYGGSFTHGFASVGSGGYDFSLEAGIICVTFNYRVGPFGFLSTGDEVIPGNMGLKDQLFALKWVQKNIHLFGGDPKKVTISGQSAGAASVTYHILSPESAGLFRGAIASSGSALNVWANANSSSLHVARAVARSIDKSLSRNCSPREIYDVLMKADANDIHITGTYESLYGPVIEKDHEGAFITESMYQLLKEGKFNKVPLFIGFNSEEYISLAGNEAHLISLAKKYDDDVRALVNRDFFISDDEVSNEAGIAIKNAYTGGEDFKNNHGAIVRFTSDDMFIRGVIRYAQMQANFTDVFLYEFSYHGIIGGNNLTCEGCGRVGHGEDGKYCNGALNLANYPKSDVNTVKRYSGFHNNFVKTLNPTPIKEEIFQNIIWPKLNPKNIHYVDINEDLTIKQHPRNSVYDKWVKIYDKYAVEPLLTY